MIANEEKDFVLWKHTAQILEKSLNDLFSKDDTPIVVEKWVLEFESDKMRITVKFEEIQ